MSTLARHLNAQFGYTCQTWLSIDISDRYFSSVYRVWFSTCINPSKNGDSSNPIHLFQELDRIVQTNDRHHSKIDQLRQNLSSWILGSNLSPIDISNIVAEIVSAPIPAFRPHLWKINLSNIHFSRLVSLGQFPDEYLLKDLLQPEIEVIV